MISSWRIFCRAALAGFFLGCTSSVALAAQAGLVLGHPEAGADSATAFQQTQQTLAQALQRSVSRRSFGHPTTLRDWLVRYRELDFACLPRDVLADYAAGEVLRVGTCSLPGDPATIWVLVARQGITPALLETASAGADAPTPELAHQRSGGSEPGPDAPRDPLSVARPLSADPASTAVAAAVSPQARPEPMPSPAKEEFGEAASGAATAAVQQEADPLTGAENAPITLQADLLRYDQADGRYLARGDVRLRRGETLLTTEELLWQATTQDAVADGKVVVETPQGRLDGSSLRYNLATGRGELRDGNVFLEDGHFYLTGRQIEQTGTATYRVDDGRFTTCDGIDPDWDFTAREVQVNLGDYATARHAWFHIRGIPVLYTPYLVFPVKTERESGFLAPEIGQSRQEGTKLSLAWHQVIDRHMDATVQLDLMSEIGLGKGLEYRYLLGRTNRGEARYYHVSGRDKFPDMYAFDWLHDGRLPAGFRLSADLQHVSDRRFFETFGEVADEYNKDKTVSDLWLQRNWDKLNMVLRGRYIKDLDDPEADPVQRLPELSVHQAPYKLGPSPFYARLESYLTHFDRDQAEEGQRVYLQPALAASLKLGDWLEFVPEIGLVQRYYDTDQQSADLFVPAVSATLASHLQRVFDLEGQPGARLRHSIEPTVAYSYMPSRDEEDLPHFDFRDRLTPRNLLNYALINRLHLRSRSSDGSASYLEIARLRLSQSYDIDVARHGGTDAEPFSDLRIELDLQPTWFSSFSFDGRLRVHGPLQFSRIHSSAGLQDTGGNALSLDYVYIDDQPEVAQTEYAGLVVQTALFDPVFLRFEERYSFEDGRELEKVAALEYRSQCWSLYLTYRDRLDDREVLLSFELAGLGRVGEIGASIGERD